MTCGNAGGVTGGPAGDAAGGGIGYFNQIAEDWARLATIPDAVCAAVGDALCLPAGGCALDAGCGSGLLIPVLLDLLGPDGRAVGLDPARRMIAVASRRLRDPRVRLRCLPVAEYDGRDGPFDGILCCRTLHHLPDPAAALVRMAGWLRPSGRLAVLHETDAAADPDRDKAIGDGSGNGVEPDLQNAVRWLRTALVDAGLHNILEARPAAGWRLLTAAAPGPRLTTRC